VIAHPLQHLARYASPTRCYSAYWIRRILPQAGIRPASFLVNHDAGWRVPYLPISSLADQRSAAGWLDSHSLALVSAARSLPALSFAELLLDLSCCPCHNAMAIWWLASSAKTSSSDANDGHVEARTTARMHARHDQRNAERRSVDAGSGALGAPAASHIPTRHVIQYHDPLAAQHTSMRRSVACWHAWVLEAAPSPALAAPARLASFRPMGRYAPSTPKDVRM